MEHQFYIDRLSAFFDNELKNEELVIVKQHIDSCAECQDHLKKLEKLENFISDKSQLAENDYWEQSAKKIESALDAQTKTEVVPFGKSSTSSSGLWWKLTGVAASLALVAIIAFEEKDTKDELLQQESPVFYNEQKQAPAESLQIDNPIADNVEITSIEIPKITEENKNQTPAPTKHLAPKKIPLKSTSQSPPAVILESEKLNFDIYESEPTEPTDTIRSSVFSEELQESDPQVGASKLKPTQAASKENVEQKLDNTIAIPLTTEDDKTILLGDFSKKSTTLLKVKKRNTVQALSQSAETKPKISALLDSPTKNADHQLDYWRRKISENLKLLKIQSNRSLRFSKKAPRDTSQTKKVEAHADTNLIYKQLFEAYYKVAVMTSDTLEEKNVVELLHNYVDSTHTSYNSSAIYYYQLYKNEK